MITLEDALKIVLTTVRPLALEEIALPKAHGRTLAEDVTAGDDVPCYDNSAMDGYAVIAADLPSASEEAPVTLRLCEAVPAGKLPQKRLARGYASRIMTGAPIPKGADAVVMVERTDVFAHRQAGMAGIKACRPSRPMRKNTKTHKDNVRCFQAVKKGENVRLAGEDMKKGQVVLRAGDLVRPQEMGLLGSIGCVRLRVFRRPRVAILSTGDEIIECDQPLTAGKVRNSNAYTLTGLVQKYGGEPTRLGIAPDTKAALRERLVEGLRYDMIVTTGGVSVGDYDYVKDVLQDLHWQLKFWEVASKPGKPVAFGMLNGKRRVARRATPVFGLPGNPSGTAVAFDQLVRPALLKMQGRKRFGKLTVKARLLTDIKKKPGRTEFVPGVVTQRDGLLHASRCGASGSGVLRPLCLANAYIIFPKDASSLKKGDVVEVQFHDGPEMQ